MKRRPLHRKGEGAAKEHQAAACGAFESPASRPRSPGASFTRFVLLGVSMQLIHDLA